MMSKQPENLKQLVARALDGDEAAWAGVVEQVTPVIVAVCRSMRLSREETLDMFGQVCYLLLTHLGKIKSPDKLLSWTATVTRREVLTFLRRSRLFDQYVGREVSLSDVAGNSEPERDLHLAEQAELLLRAIRRLPKRHAQLIWLLFLDETQLSYEQIAKKLNMPTASIGPTRQRALERLQTILRSMGYEF